MEFGWINLFGGIIVLLMLIPNIVYALKNREERNLCTNRVMNVVEQAGRYGCIVWMWLPLLVWKFGFRSASEMLLYFLGNGVTGWCLPGICGKRRPSGPWCWPSCPPASFF